MMLLLLLLFAVWRMFSSLTFSSITVRRPTSISAFASTFLWSFAITMLVITAAATAARITSSATASTTMTGTITGLATTTLVLGTAWWLAFLPSIGSGNGKCLSQFREILQRRSALMFVTQLRILRHVESVWFQSFRAKISLYQWSLLEWLNRIQWRAEDFRESYSPATITQPPSTRLSQKRWMSTTLGFRISPRRMRLVDPLNSSRWDATRVRLKSSINISSNAGDNQRSYSSREKKMRWMLVLLLITVVSSAPEQMDFWLTDPDRKILFQEQSPLFPTVDGQIRSSIVIEVNSTERYQSMDGFGFALTGGSALQIYQLENVTRAALLRELFGTDDTQIGISYLRLSIGSSDLNAAVFSYDDLGTNETDVNITRFSLDNDRQSLIPLLKEILAINPRLKLLASPSSPPVWMKSNGKSIGEHLLPEYYDAYALYFVRYIEEMKGEGINIDAITIQNEALYGGNNPSMVMQAEEQVQFIKQSLGPAFRGKEIATKIFIYDDNPDRPDYPLTILADREARDYVDGSAFHMYAGRIETLSLVRSRCSSGEEYLFHWTMDRRPGTSEERFVVAREDADRRCDAQLGSNGHRMKSRLWFELETSHTRRMWQLSRGLDHRWQSSSFTEKCRLLHHRSCRQVRSTEFSADRIECPGQHAQCRLSTAGGRTTRSRPAQRTHQRTNSIRDSFPGQSLAGVTERGQCGNLRLVRNGISPLVVGSIERKRKDAGHVFEWTSAREKVRRSVPVELQLIEMSSTSSCSVAQCVPSELFSDDLLVFVDRIEFRHSTTFTRGESNSFDQSSPNSSFVRESHQLLRDVQLNLRDAWLSIEMEVNCRWTFPPRIAVNFWFNPIGVVRHRWRIEESQRTERSIVIVEIDRHSTEIMRDAEVRRRRVTEHNSFVSTESLTDFDRQGH